MTNKITVGSIIGCGTAISAPPDENIEISVTTIAGCQKAIDLRDPPSLMERLGLPIDTSPSLLSDLLRQLQNPGLAQDEVSSRIKRSQLRDVLGAGADISTVTAAIWNLYQSDLVQAVLKALPS
jgi:hypothetical protein